MTVRTGERTYEFAIEYPRGQHGKPLSTEDAKRKFRQNDGNRLGDEQIDDLLGRASRLERLDAVSELLAAT